MEQALLTVAEARARICAQMVVVSAEWVALEEALGRVLAAPMVAREALPPFANSGMDGYAVRAADVAGATAEAPTRLRVIGDIAAGRVLARGVAAGETARIMTGAPMPEGADAVVPVEQTDVWPEGAHGPAPATVGIRRSVDVGAYVRPVGQDMRVGDALMEVGHVVRPADIAVLAALGEMRVSVYRQPRVALLSTGDELVAADQVPGPGQIRNSNTYALAALVREAGGVPLVLGIARDSLDEVRAHLRAGLAQGADLFISSAGVSVGAYDVVRPAVEAEGALGFWRVDMRPGKPLAFGRVGAVPFVGLPGNPVSAMVTFELFVRPALFVLGGRPLGGRRQIKVRLDAALESDGRESYLRAIVRETETGYRALLTGDQGSAVMTSLVKANALVVVPRGVKRVAEGAELVALVLREL